MSKSIWYFVSTSEGRVEEEVEGLGVDPHDSYSQVMSYVLLYVYIWVAYILGKDDLQQLIAIDNVHLFY